MKKWDDFRVRREQAIYAYYAVRWKIESAIAFKKLAIARCVLHTQFRQYKLYKKEKEIMQSKMMKAALIVNYLQTMLKSTLNASLPVR